MRKHLSSIIIPAHNEASVISRCLGAILNQGEKPYELEIIVVCNGCTDNTASLARSFNKEIIVIETDIASKSNALNLGDKHASGFPRFYIDADVIVPFESIRKTANALKRKHISAAAPAMHIDCTDRSWPVKAFYQVWLHLPYCREGMIGSGIYALSKQGRQKFKNFPSITADDGYVRLLFTPQERATVQSCHFTIIPPKNLNGIIKIKTRAYFGTLELRHNFPNLCNNEKTIHSTALKQLFFRPRWWGGLIIYCYVRIIARINARYRYHFNIKHKWDRDESSR